MKAVWSKIKKIARKSKASPFPLLEENGQIISCPNQVAEKMAQHFATVGKNINRSLEFVWHKNRIESTPMKIAQDDSEPFIGPITLAKLPEDDQ